jgi:hypothetical protein
MKKHILLWLDDLRNPIKRIPGEDYTWLEKYAPVNDITNFQVVWVKTYDEFCNHISKNGLPTVICFDNDLGQQKEGYDCAKWLVEYCMNNKKQLPKYNVHSYNTVARENIFKLLDNFIKQSL